MFVDSSPDSPRRRRRAAGRTEKRRGTRRDIERPLAAVFHDRKIAPQIKLDDAAVEADEGPDVDDSRVPLVGPQDRRRRRPSRHSGASQHAVVAARFDGGVGQIYVRDLVAAGGVARLMYQELTA